MNSKDFKPETTNLNNKDFGTLFNEFHTNNPNAWKEFQREKRGPKSPKREIDFIEYMLQTDISLVCDLIYYIVKDKRMRRYGLEMSKIDREDAPIPSEILLATISTIEEQRFLSQFEPDYELNASKIQIPESAEGRAALEKIFARDDVFKKIKTINGSPSKASPEDAFAKENVKKMLSKILQAMQNYNFARGKVLAGPPDGLILTKTSIDLDQFLREYAQVNRSGIQISEEMMTSDIRVKVSETHWKPGTGLEILRVRRYTDFLICGINNYESINILVTCKQQAVENCISKIKKEFSLFDEDIRSIVEYLKNLLVILQK